MHNQLILNVIVQKKISGLSTLVDSTQTEITFLENKKYLNDLKNTKAAAVLINEKFANEVPSGTIALICDEPYLNLAKLSKIFAAEVIETDGKRASYWFFNKAYAKCIYWKKFNNWV